MPSFEKDRIEGFDRYSRVEPEVFEYFLKMFEKNEFTVSAAKTRLWQIAPGYTAFAWRVEDKNLPGTDGTINAVELYHQGIHALIADKFGGRRRGRPLTTLLNEAIGAGLDFYFTTRGLQEGLPNNTFQLPVFVDISVRAGKPIKRQLAEGVKDPFRVYGKIVLETFGMYRALLESLKKGESPDKTLVRFQKHVSKSRYYLCYALYSTCMQPYYIAMYCGYKSDKTDLANVKALTKLLGSSKTLREFVEKLGIKELI